MRSQNLNLGNISDLDRAEYFKAVQNAQNGDLGDKDGYDCAKCNNRGFVWEIEKEPPYNEYTIPCDCMKVRANIRRMKRSGLESALKRCKFESYEDKEDWQKSIKQKAVEFVKNADSLEAKWFFVGGGNGIGKTHLCTAIAREFLLSGKDVRYMRWVEDSQKLKGTVNEFGYLGAVAPYKTAKVLYVDDFLKVTKTSENEPSKADIRLAYEILDYRYQNRDLITIISSERHVNEIESIDSAVGSRIYELAKGYCLNVSKNKSRNYRLKGIEVI